jgi:hypothetical protein
MRESGVADPDAHGVRGGIIRRSLGALLRVHP